MAGGFAQATGRPALLHLHAAAGMGNAMGNLINTQSGHVPVIVTSGQHAQVHRAEGLPHQRGRAEAGRADGEMEPRASPPAGRPAVPVEGDPAGHRRTSSGKPHLIEISERRLADS
jgi:hypothetical protein